MSPEEAEAKFLEIYRGAAPLAAKAARSALVVCVAVWLAWAQRYTTYSLVGVGALAFAFSVFNRYVWVSGILLVWLMALYLAPPEMVAAIKGMGG